MKKFSSKVHHIALYVEDIREKTSLFEDVFGMTVTLADGDPENPTQVWLDGGIQLISRPDKKECEIAHLALVSEREGEAAGNLEEYGGETLSRGENWIRFPDHLVLELMEVEI